MLVIIFYFLSFFSYSQNEWEHVFFNKSETELMTNIVCIDSLNCYFLGYDRGVFLYESKDGGKTWSFKWKSPPYEENKLNHYTSASDFCVVDTSNMVFSTYDRGFILKSSDGGNSFNLVKLGIPELIRNLAMYDEKIGIAIMGRYYFITKDGWETFESLDKIPLAIYRNPRFINDSTLQFVYNVFGAFLTELNINTLEFTEKYIYNDPSLSDFQFITENTIIAIGYNHTGEGDETKDRILKSTDKGETWRLILDTLVRPAFPLQSVAFKDSLVGIAVGQSGKILYTYDGGESWIYEENRPEYFRRTPTVLKVVYAGETPLIAMHRYGIFRLKKDNLLSVKDIEIIDFQIINKKLYIQGNNFFDMKITICDPLGKVIISKRLEHENDLSNLNPGKYFISIYNNNEIIRSVGVVINE